MQEFGEKEIKADEEKKTDEKKMDKNFSMAPINVQMVAIDIKVFIFLCVSYFPLKCDPLEEAPYKA